MSKDSLIQFDISCQIRLSIYASFASCLIQVHSIWFRYRVLAGPVKFLYSFAKVDPLKVVIISFVPKGIGLEVLS